MFLHAKNKGKWKHNENLTTNPIQDQQTIQLTRSSLVIILATKVTSKKETMPKGLLLLKNQNQNEHSAKKQFFVTLKNILTLG